jgi:hypothetical protein
MESAAGLGALGFWLFVAACVVGGIWDAARKRESQQETLRRLVESGNDIDTDVLEQVLNAGDKAKNLGRDLKVSGLIVIFVSPGLAIMGLFLARINEEALMPLLGASFLTGFVGIGLLVAGRYADQMRQDQTG